MEGGGVTISASDASSSSTSRLRYLIKARNCISLRALLSLHDIEFNVIAFFEALVSVELNCRIVDEDIWTIVTADESIAFCVVEPFHLAFIGSHEPCLSSELTRSRNDI